MEMLLTQPNQEENKTSYILIQNKDVEGDLKVDKVLPLTYNKPRVAIAIFLSIITGFLFLLFCRWYIQLRVWFFYKQTTLDLACMLLVQDNHNKQSLVSIQKSTTNQYNLFFTYCFLNYIFDTHLQLFKPIQCPLIEKSADQIKNSKPLQQYQVQELHQTYGPCLISIPLPSIIDFLFDELTSPFYFIQYLSITLWISESFIQLAIMTFVVSVLSSLINYFILLRSSYLLKQKAKQIIKVKVRRADTVKIIDSIELVPGDIIELENNIKMPCDCILLDNEVLVDEQTLTGESVPVQKLPIKDSLLKKNILFDGTKIVFLRNAQAIVIRTGFSSYKGQIFRNALFPNPVKVRFYKDAVKFLIMYATIVFSIYFGFIGKMIQLNFTPTLIFFRYNYFSINYIRFGDALIWVLTPTLIIFVNFCMTMTLVRLRMKNIYGTRPHKNMESGDVNMICFDKTGTLTTDQIDVKLIKQMEKNSLAENDTIAELVTEIDKQSHLIYSVMGTCHNCYQNLKDGELIGDVLDLSLIKFSSREINYKDTEAKFSVSYQNFSHKYDVIRILDFESQLQMMSVIAVEMETKDVYLFAKGAPEKINNICFNSPVDFQDNLTRYALQGFRVLAFAYKKLEENQIQLDRSQLEQELTFLGLVALENKLKDDTIQLVDQLRKADIDVKIVSGDSPLTTIHCGKECSMIPFSGSVLLIDCIEELVLHSIQGMQVQQLKLDESNSSLEINKQIELVGSILANNQKEKKQLEMDETQIVTLINGGIHDVAITGPALEYMERKFSIDTIQLIIRKTKILARIHPEQKTKIICQLQLQGFCVAMIGDGANDCSAIKMANIGISFADTDASNTSAFSSISNSIACVKEVILQGKATQSNVLEAFKYFMIINITKFVAAEILMLDIQNFSNNQFLYMNYLSNIPLLIVFAMTPPSSKLTPHIIETSMMNYKNCVPLFLIIGLSVVGFQFAYMLMISKDGYIENQGHTSQSQYSFQGQSNTLLFLVLNIQYIFSFIAIYTGRPFKPPIYKLPHLYVPAIIFFILITFVTFVQIPGLSSFLDLVELNSLFAVEAYFIQVGFGIIMILVGYVTWQYSYK